MSDWSSDVCSSDLDLGHYERFLDLELTRKNTTLSGRLLRDLIADERAGKFGGQTVQMVPHLTNSIKAAILLAPANTGKGYPRSGYICAANRRILLAVSCLCNARQLGRRAALDLC